MTLDTAQFEHSSDVDDIDLDKLDFGDDVEDAAAPEEGAAAPEPTPEKAPEPEAEKPAPAAEPEGEAPPEAAKPEPESKPDGDASKPSAAIPKHRFDFVQQKRREAEERAAALEAEIAKLRDQPKEPPKPIDQVLAEMDLEIEKARLDGDAEKAAQLRGEQRRIEMQIVEQRSSQSGEQMVTQAQEMQRLNELIDKLEATYPQFVEGDAAYDKDLVDEVLDLHSAYIAKGMPPSMAMAKASSYVLRANGLDKPKAEEPPKPEAPPVKKTDVKKNVAAAKAQPPPLESVGFDSAKGGVTKKVDISRMTIEEFEKLGEGDLAEVRGDFDV